MDSLALTAARYSCARALLDDVIFGVTSVFRALDRRLLRKDYVRARLPCQSTARQYNAGRTFRAHSKRRSRLMFFDSRPRAARAANWLCPLAAALALMIFALAASAQDTDITKKLDGFDAYMAQTLKDWNT